MAIGDPLLTDLYELNMAASYLRRGMAQQATFSLFVRSLPPTRGFLVAAGLEDCLDYLEQLHFSSDDIDYLAELGYGTDELDQFRQLRFSSDVWAVPEGRIVFADEPLLEVTAPLPEAQLVETLLLNQVTYQTNLATKAARCRLAAAGRIDLVDFSLRRTHGIEAGAAVARCSAMVGFVATSNVAAARRFGLVPAGTMAHSYIEAFPNEQAAFRAFAEDFPDRVTFLVDTYDTLRGVQHAIEVIRERDLGDRAAVRLDSGDLADLARQTRTLLDDAQLPGVRIFVSGGLDEFDLEQLVIAGAPIDAAGVGTRLGVAADAPYLDSVYKLVAVDGRPVMKLSPGKVTRPGAKQIFRAPGLSDTLALRDEPRPAEPPATERLLVPVMAGGRRMRARDALAVARARFEEDLAVVPPGAAALTNPRAPRPAVSPALEALTARTAAGAAAGASGHAQP
ncbi:MAG TPA: nicotinate phosphoribosyltransferase [Thermoleophilia bacterium]|nr:nicotinate phosphoribosyltransferase [Thermoleophilia bacterium]